MKSLVFIIIFCELEFASAHEKLNPQARRQNCLSDMDGATARYCHVGLKECSKDLYEYSKTDILQMTQLVREAGSNQICRVVIDTSECVTAKLGEQRCQNLPDYYFLVSAYQTIDFAKYACKQKREDIAKHWDCLFSQDVVSQILQCKGRILEPPYSFNAPGTKCEFYKPLGQCFQDVVDSTDQCQNGAGELARELLIRHLLIGSDCPIDGLVNPTLIQSSNQHHSTIPPPDSFAQNVQQNYHGYVRKSVNTGSSVILDCDKKFVNNSEAEYPEPIIRLWRNDTEVPIYIQLGELSPYVDRRYQGRVKVLGNDSIEISEITKSDEALYECEIMIAQDSDYANVERKWVYITVTDENSQRNVW